MSYATKLRRLADLYRRLAKVPTTGGHGEDRLLLVLAERLDGDASVLEHSGAGSSTCSILGQQRGSDERDD